VVVKQKPIKAKIEASDDKTSIETPDDKTSIES
jgi:hypothetical protein